MLSRVFLITFNIADELFANIVVDGVHLSLCFKHRHMSFKKVPE